MADGCMRERWQHTSSLIAKIHNVNVTDESDARPPSAFDPFAPKPKPIPPSEGMAIARAVFVPNSIK